MPDEKQRFSAEELNRLLDDLAPAAGAPQGAADELDRTLADILGQGRSDVSAAPPAPRKAARGGPAQPVPPKPAVEQPAPKKELIPQQERRPFTADEGLQLDDNPLVSEDFRRFFTTSVTPDALFSNREEGRPTHKTTAWQLPLQPKHGHAKPAETEPEMETEEPALEQEQPRRRQGLFAALKEFFLSDEQPEDEELQEDIPEPAAETAADVVEELPPVVQPATDTTLFEKVQQPAAAADLTGQTTVFDPVTAGSAEPTPTVEFEAADQAQPPVGSGQPVEEIAEGQAAPEQEQPDSDGPAEGTLTREDEPEQPEGALSEDELPQDDYYAVSQQTQVASTLRGMVLSLTVRAAVLCLLALVSVYFGLAAVFPALPQLAGLVSASSAGVFTLGVQLVCLLLGGAVSHLTLRGGLQGLLEEPSADSFAALSWCGALLQTLVLLLTVGSFDTARPVYAGFALLALFTGALGKRSLAVGVQKNFDRLTKQEAGYAVATLMQDAGLVRRLTHGLGESEPCLLVSRPTDFYDGFLHQSFGTRQGDHAARRVCRLLPAAALLAGILGVIFDAGFVQPFAAVLCIACPLAMVLVSAVPAYFMNKSARAIGTILPGPAALEDLGQANVVVANAGDLFPGDSVTLKGMKVFGQHRIDHAILYAASLLVPHCSTLRGVFLNIIQDRTELLYEVENLNIETGCGLEGWTDSRHLLVGNRGMMISHGVQVPPQDYEARYTRDGRYSPVYLAVNGRLAAMFVVGYRPNAQVKELLDEVYVSGLSLLVTSDDFNLTGERIDTVYGIPSGCIKVLGAAESQRLAACTAPCSRCTGAMVHTATSLRGYLEGIRIAAAASGMEKAACTLQTASVAVGTLLVLILTCTGGLLALNAPAILLYQLAWLVLILLLPCAKQY